MTVEQLERGKKLVKNIEDYEEKIDCVEHGAISVHYDGRVVWLDEDIFKEIIVAQLKKDLDFLKLKDLREENKVLTSECDRLINEKGELLKKSEQIAEYKRLLKMAVEDISKMPCHNDTHSPDSCYICVKHGNCTYADSFKWCKADIALKLIGETNDEP